MIPKSVEWKNQYYNHVIFDIKEFRLPIKIETTI